MDERVEQRSSIRVDRLELVVPSTLRCSLIFLGNVEKRPPAFARATADRPTAFSGFAGAARTDMWSQFCRADVLRVRFARQAYSAEVARRPGMAAAFPSVLLRTGLDRSFGKDRGFFEHSRIVFFR